MNNTVTITAAEDLNKMFPLVEGLSPDVLHSPSEVREHKAKFQARLDAIHKYQNEQRLVKVAADAKRNAPLTEQEYYEEAVKRQEAIHAQRVAVELAEAAAKALRQEYLDSSPAEVSLGDANPVRFMQEFEHWVRKGYVADHQRTIIGLNFFESVLTAPVKKGKPQ